MSELIPQSKPEKKEGVEDNARKFTLDKIDPKFLKEYNATSFELIVDWLETGEDNEKKLAYKKFEDGTIQILLISKITKGGNRTSDKRKISEGEYKELLNSSILHLKKKRYEFEYNQEGTKFNLKYDKFDTGNLNMLEVDALTEKEMALFKPANFPNNLSEVTGDINYYGYRIVEML